MADNRKIAPVSGNHSITIEARNKMSVTGVMDVSEFSEDKIEIVTNMGVLTVKGKKLNVNALNTDSGELKMSGEVRSCEYSNRGRREGVLTGLFK